MNLLLLGINYKTSLLEIRELSVLSAQQEQALEALTYSLINKILHTPFTELKQAASRPDRSEFLEVVRTIFHLEDPARAQAARAVN